MVNPVGGSYGVINFQMFDRLPGLGGKGGLKWGHRSSIFKMFWGLHLQMSVV